LTSVVVYRKVGESLGELLDKKMKKYLSSTIVLICITGAIGFWIHARITDPKQHLRIKLGRDVVQWYYNTLSIRHAGIDNLRHETERNHLESIRKKAWGIPAEVSLFFEETEFHDISHDELLLKYTAYFTYPGLQESVIVTETYLADAEYKFPLPIKREIIDTKAIPRLRKVFLWDCSFNEYLQDRFGCKIVVQSSVDDVQNAAP
jgi:hypothetical protein